MNKSSNVKSAFIFDENIKDSGQCMILGHIIRNIRQNETKSYDINILQLCDEIETVNLRMRKTIMEIIQHYSSSNPQLFTVMGKQDKIPYSGYYDSTKNSTTFDMRLFPDSLVIILYEFIKLNNQHSK